MKNIKARAADFYHDHTDAIAATVLTAGFAFIIYRAKQQSDALVETIIQNADMNN